MLQLINNLPEDLINHVKEYALTPKIRLQLFYQNNKFDESTLKKMLKVFTSKQLEQINWKYIYFKIYKTSPPKLDNKNLVPIFELVPNPIVLNIFSNTEYEPCKIYYSSGPLCKYKLFNIIRSDYYSENVHTEIGRKRQQYKNIIGGWKSIHEGSGTANILEIDNYLSSVEFELIKTITLLYKHYRALR
jgi:hypothetical protein